MTAQPHFVATQRRPSATLPPRAKLFLGVMWRIVVFYTICIATVVAAIVSFIAVKWLLRYVQTHTFNAFGWYRIALAIGGVRARSRRR